MKAVSAILATSLISSAAAFAPSTSTPSVAKITSLDASFDPLNLSEPEPKDDSMPVMKFAATAAASLALHPLAAIAG